MTIMEMETMFKTRDLYLASFLKAKGLSLLDTRRENARVFFIFEDKEKAEGLKKEFFNGGVVSISLFTKAVQDLKSLIYSD